VKNNDLSEHHALLERNPVTNQLMLIFLEKMTNILVHNHTIGQYVLQMLRESGLS
jgi:hypothetical protein